ncbi:uncharacterized protein Gasu_03160 [Galdieria sulphuraria]|uniref:Uncharacterized protein n=1 Tax=Galdieria sulphuraria TaxID=130081 RepID=M2XQN1_GALSU|nr:uncharacterized protein Gasu_03160 [Galdieria sulphuraria]EME32542.1 hypothetical protein Gasu_03160 [Galdieria sulphuraria]|eukprot:XP_005709062.1 hypothetical protein Gasu_03160 [Galdieria sulphuraria]
MALHFFLRNGANIDDPPFIVQQVALRKRCSSELFPVSSLNGDPVVEREWKKNNHQVLEEENEEWLKKPKVVQSACANLTNESILKVIQQISRGDNHLFVRNQVLESLQLTAHLVNLLQLCQGSTTFLCQLIDVNIFSKNIIELLSNYEGSQLACLNIQSRYFSVTSDKTKLLNAFCFSYVDKAKPCNIIAYVLQTLFCDDPEASICVVEGSGVACVLLADFCHMYGLTEFVGGRNWPALLIVSGFPSGRNLLVPVF